MQFVVADMEQWGSIMIRWCFICSYYHTVLYLILLDQYHNNRNGLGCMVETPQEKSTRTHIRVLRCDMITSRQASITQNKTTRRCQTLHHGNSRILMQLVGSDKYNIHLQCICQLTICDYQILIHHPINKPRLAVILNIIPVTWVSRCIQAHKPVLRMIIFVFPS